ncbi:hypothetical protein MKW98_023948, partial [Papaver atlanticum]
MDTAENQFILIRENENVMNGLRCCKVYNEGCERRHVQHCHEGVLDVLYSNQGGERAYCVHRGWKISLTKVIGDSNYEGFWEPDPDSGGNYDKLRNNRLIMMKNLMASAVYCIEQ